MFEAFFVSLFAGSPGHLDMSSMRGEYLHLELIPIYCLCLVAKVRFPLLTKKGRQSVFHGIEVDGFDLILNRMICFSKINQFNLTQYLATATSPSFLKGRVGMDEIELSQVYPDKGGHSILNTSKLISKKSQKKAPLQGCNEAFYH